MLLNNTLSFNHFPSVFYFFVWEFFYILDDDNDDGDDVDDDEVEYSPMKTEKSCFVQE